MDDLPTETFCPVNRDNVCREVRDNKVHICRWFVKMAGKDEKGDDVEEWRCAHVWAPVLMVESSSTNRGISAAINSLRNETVKRQELAISRLKGIEDANTPNR